MKTSYFHALLSVLILAFAGLGYWSYTSIDISFDDNTAPSGAVVVSGDSRLDTAAVISIDSQQQTPPKDTTAPVQQDAEKISTEKSREEQKKIPAKYTYLANRLNNLINDKIFMKLGSKGTRVGTVQEFMNIYEGKKELIDNKYGADLQARVQKFQQTAGDNPDGFADPVTYQKMLDALKDL